MNKEIAKDEFESITELVNNALAAPNKASAKTYLGQLEFKKTLSAQDLTPTRTLNLSRT